MSYGTDIAPDPAPPEEDDECTPANYAYARGELFKLREANRKLRGELEAHQESTAWTISPAMAQARLDQLNAQVEKMQKDTALLDRLDVLTAAEFLGRPGAMTGREILERNIAAKEAERQIELS